MEWIGLFKYAKLKDNQDCHQPDDKGKQTHQEKMLIETSLGSQIWFHDFPSWEFRAV